MLIVEQSISEISFSLIRLPPKPESNRILATENMTAKTPIVPKASGFTRRARIIVVNKNIACGAKRASSPQQ